MTKARLKARQDGTAQVLCADERDGTGRSCSCHLGTLRPKFVRGTLAWWEIMVDGEDRPRHLPAVVACLRCGARNEIYRPSGDESSSIAGRWKGDR